MLEGFKKFNVSIGTISISVTKNGISFSRTAVIRMEKAEYVCLYIDEQTKRIAIVQAQENEEGATKFYKNQKTVAVRWNNTELLKTICKMMEWDLSSNLYKVEGEFIPEEKAIIFDLKRAKTEQAKSAGGTNIEEE